MDCYERGFNGNGYVLDIISEYDKNTVKRMVFHSEKEMMEYIRENDLKLKN